LPVYVVLNPDSPEASTAFLANSRFVPASLPVGRQKKRTESSETEQQK